MRAYSILEVYNMSKQYSVIMDKMIHTRAKSYCKFNGYSFSGLIQSMLRDKLDEEGY